MTIYATTYTPNLDCDDHGCTVPYLVTVLDSGLVSASYEYDVDSLYESLDALLADHGAGNQMRTEILAAKQDRKIDLDEDEIADLVTQYEDSWSRPAPRAWLDLLASMVQDERTEDSILVAWLGGFGSPEGYWPSDNETAFEAALRARAIIKLGLDSEVDDGPRSLGRYMDALSIEFVEDHGDDYTYLVLAARPDADGCAVVARVVLDGRDWGDPGLRARMRDIVGDGGRWVSTTDSLIKVGDLVFVDDDGVATKAS